MAKEVQYVYAVWENVDEDEEPYQVFVTDLKDLNTDDNECVAVYELKRVGKLKVKREVK